MVTRYGYTATGQYRATRAYRHSLRLAQEHASWEREIRRQLRRRQRPPLLVQLWIATQREHRGVVASLVLYAAACLVGLLPDPYGWLLAGAYGLLGSLALRDAILRGSRLDTGGDVRQNP
jgi:hypothetical protein